jgi:hypothetical protein
MADFIADVSQELQDKGGIGWAHKQVAICLAGKGHRWRDLRTNVQPPASYCENCLLVSLNEHEFWPVPPKPPLSGTLAEWI